MKRFLALCLFVLMLSGTVTTALHAAAPGCDDGTIGGANKTPNGGMWGTMQRHADANRVRDNAYTNEIIERNDPSLGVTCFDQGTALSSRMGGLFSDVVPKGIPPADLEVFDPTDNKVSYPNFGSDTFLIQDFASTLNGKASKIWLNGAQIDNPPSAIGDPLHTILQNFPDSLSAPLGTTNGDALATMMTGSLDGMLSGLLGSITAITSKFGDMATLVTSFESALSVLESIAPDLVAMAKAALSAAKSLVDTIISTIMTMIDTLIDTFVQPILDFISSAATSLFGSDTNNATDKAAAAGVNPPVEEKNCNQLATLWGGKVTDTTMGGGINDFVPIEGGGITKGTPFFSFGDLVGGGPASGLGDVFKGQLGTIATGNKDILDLVKNTDLTGTGILTGPAATKSPWKSVPALNPSADSVASIISKMN